MANRTIRTRRVSRKLLPVLRPLKTFKRRGKKSEPRRKSSRLSHLPFDWRRVTLAVGTIAVLSFLMSIHFLPDRVTLSIGERSPAEIRAARSVTYYDTDATTRQRANAALRIPRVFDPDHTALAQSTHTVSDVFEAIHRARGNAGTSGSTRRSQILAAELGTTIAPHFTSEQLRFLATTPLPTLDRLQNSIHRLIENAQSQPIRSDGSDVERARQEYDREAGKANSTPGKAIEVGVAQVVGRLALRANQIYNPVKTRQLRDAEMRHVPPVPGELRAGEVVIHEGEVFSQLHQDKATALGLISPRLDVVTALSICALAGAMVLLVGYYLRVQRPDLYDSPKHLFLLAAIVITSVFGLKIFGQMLGLPLSIVQFSYLGMMMVVAAGMMVAVLMDLPLAILVTALLSVQSGLIMNHELRFSVMTLISSLVGIYSVSEMRDRQHLLRAIAAVAATNLALVWVLGGLLGDTLREVVSGSAWAVFAAAIGVGVFWFGIIALEKPFGILTHAWLLELSASEHPLLRELCLTAPGTYAHSIMVGNLAEAGAEAIGANALFCRVASYYHDVGKMRNPQFFVENQHAENVHNRLKPSLSALVIASHVRDGVEMAIQHKLPAQIVAVVAEHHGTSLIQYFYNRALEEGGAEARHDPVLEQHFRYDGPRPQTRESGIIMLADTIEAAIRCLDKPTPARIQGRIEELVHQKLADGQLDECDLTFKDIQKIQAAFARLLSAMLHGRVAYPNLSKPSPGLIEQGLNVDTLGSLDTMSPETYEPLSQTPASQHTSEKASALHGGHHPELSETPHSDEIVVASRPSRPPL